MNYFQLTIEPGEMTTPLVAHVPHSSVAVPDPWRSQIILDDVQLADELVAMTDRYTDELFVPAVSESGGTAFVNRLSRLVFDPERFEDDQSEPMSALGMGAVYTTTSSLEPLRAGDFPAAAREQIVRELFRPYASALADTVTATLESFGRCLIIDCHSFPSVPLPYEDSGLSRPDLCIGFDPHHAPEILVHAIEKAAHAHDWSTARNEPFGGSYVPLRHYGVEPKVSSVMLEINRSRYMDETTAERSSDFEAAASVVAELVSTAVLFEAFRHTSFVADVPGERVTIRVGERCSALDRLLDTHDVVDWAFVTAYNPSGQQASVDENQRADRDLIMELDSRKLLSFSGAGEPDVGDWAPEPSHLVIGISEQDAIALGKRLGQAAIVVGMRGEAARLIAPD